MKNDPDANVRISKEKFSEAILSAERNGYLSCADLLFTEEAETIFGDEIRAVGQWLTERMPKVI